MLDAEKVDRVVDPADGIHVHLKTREIVCATATIMCEKGGLEKRKAKGENTANRKSSTNKGRRAIMIS